LPERIKSIRAGIEGSIVGEIRPVRLKYFALLREQRGLDAETRQTAAATARELYREIAAAYGFTLPEERVGVAVNDAFASWDRTLAANDMVVFIPPVAGG
jgi:molybdopterin converting factor small subunit